MVLLPRRASGRGLAGGAGTQRAPRKGFLPAIAHRGFARAVERNASAVPTERLTQRPPRAEKARCDEVSSKPVASCCVVAALRRIRRSLRLTLPKSHDQ